MQVHAIVLGTGLVLHEMAAVLGGAQRGLQSPPIDKDVVHSLNCSQGILRLQVGHVCTCTRALITGLVMRGPYWYLYDLPEFETWHIGYCGLSLLCVFFQIFRNSPVFSKFLGPLDGAIAQQRRPNFSEPPSR